MMDRARIERLLASAVAPDLVRVDLPTLGEAVWLRRPTRAEVARIVSAAGDDLDWSAQVLVGVLRFALVSDVGELLLKSFAEAAGVMNSLPDDDVAVLMQHLTVLFHEAGDDAAADVELGKGC